MRRTRVLTTLLSITALIIGCVSAVALTAAQAATTPDTIFGSTTPAVVDSGDGNAVELGMKFTASQAGTITGIRFYKASTNTGTHVGSLWTASGTLLAQATFTGETASGWQSVTFASPVTITPGTTYVAGYFAPNGHYSYTSGGLASAITSGPLTAIGNSTSPNGVYAYGASTQFPGSSYKSDNYWVDVNFAPSSTTTTTSSTGSTSTTSSTATTSSTSSTAAPTAPATIFGNVTPATTDSGDTGAVELGVKFSSTEAGTITGIRFYKCSLNAGTHVGSLWSASGTLLAQATFTNETASGWQTVNFATPVAITAGTTYVAGYYDPDGHYADVQNALTSATSSGALSVPADGGVFNYSSASAFPSSSWNASNYYVDVDFAPSSGTATPPPTTTTTSSTSSTKTTTSTTTSTTATTSTTSTGSTPSGTCLQLQSGGLYPVYSALDACGYPSPDTAGVPAGTQLTTASSTCNCLPANTAWSGGELWISGPTTVNDLYIPGGVVLQTSSGVTIENSQIMVGGYSDGDIINGQGFGNLTVTHTTVSGTENASMNSCSDPADSDIGDVGSNITLSYDVLACAGEPINGGTYTVTHSYVIVDGYPAGAHVEDWYIPGGGSGTAQYDTLIQPNDQTAGIFADSKLGAMQTIVVTNSLIAGNQNNGGLALGCPGNEGAGNDHSITVENNRFSSAYNTSAWPFVAGNTDGGSENVWTGNVMDGSGATVSVPSSAC